MNFIKRLTTSVTASLESAASQLENHDAVIEANIKQTRQAVAKTQARLATLQQQQANFEEQLKSATTQITTWEERARSLNEKEETKALECLSRRNQSEAEAQRLQQTIEQQRQLIKKVGDNLHTLKTQLDEMAQRHNLMRSRQSVAETNKVATNSAQAASTNDTFERWEANILEHELGATVFHDVVQDPLESQFKQQENDAELREQLKQLTDNSTNNSTNNSKTN